MGEDHREPVAAGLGQHLVEAARQVQEVLALVDDQAGVDPGRLAEPGPVRGGLPHLGHDEAAEQPGGLLAEDALGDPNQADAAVEDVCPCRSWSRGRPTTWRTKSRSKKARSLFISGPMTWARLASLIGLVGSPRTRRGRPCRRPRWPPRGAERVVGEQPRARRPGWSRCPMAAPWRSRVRQAARSTSSVRGPQKAAKIERKIPTRLSTTRSGSGPDKHVEDRGRVGVLGVDEHGAGLGPCGEPVAQVGDEVALGVDDHHAAAGVDVAQDQVGEQRRLARRPWLP